jgi:ribose transport system permease protein
MTGRRSLGWPRNKSLRHIALDNLGRLSGVYALIVLIVFFSFLRPDTFATILNLRVTAESQAVATLLALALIPALSADVLDLSVAGMMDLAVVIVGWLQAHHVNAAVSVLATLALGVVVGAVNSFVVLKLRVPALIATLGMASILSAFAFWLTAGQGVSLGISSDFAKLGQGSIVGIPNPVIFMAVVALVLAFVMERMPFGRKVRAVGGNREAARTIGLPVDRLAAYVLITSAGLASLAGVVYVARLGTAPYAAGDPYLLASFAAVFLGATQIRPGKFNVLGTLVAVYLLATGVDGVQLVFPNNAWITSMFGGTALIVAVALSIRRRRRVSAPDPVAPTAAEEPVENSATAVPLTDDPRSRSGR